MILGSLLVHAVVGVAAFAVVEAGARWTAPPHAVLVTKMVRLGDIRPKELLPRKEEAPPPPPPPPPPAIPPAPASVPPTPAAPAVPIAKPADKPTPKTDAAAAVPSAKDRISAMSRMNKALERLKEKAEGDPDGSVNGDSDTQVIGDKYATEVQKCLQANYSFQGVDATKVANRKADVLIRIATDGKFIDWKIEASSGLPAFDQAVVLAVRKCGRVSPPPVEVRNGVRRDGLEITFVP